MPAFKQLDTIELARRENREIITLQGRQILRRVLNEALAEQEAQFKKGLARNQVLQLDPDKGELKALLRKTSAQVLGTGEEVEAEAEEEDE